jgi:protein involved in polysaccharide export with SLBB domain
MVCSVKLIAKHLPLLALALLVSSTQLRADDFPFKVGDSLSIVVVGGGEVNLKVTNIKGKWVEGNTPFYGLAWFNSDHFKTVLKLPPQ